MGQGEHGAVSDDGGRTWLVIDSEGRMLRCLFAGEPDWTPIRANAKRYTAQGADAALCKLRGLELAAAKVAA